MLRFIWQFRLIPVGVVTLIETRKSKISHLPFDFPSALYCPNDKLSLLTLSLASFMIYFYFQETEWKLSWKDVDDLGEITTKSNKFVPKICLKSIAEQNSKQEV